MSLAANHMRWLFAFLKRNLLHHVVTVRHNASLVHDGQRTGALLLLLEAEINEEKRRLVVTIEPWCVSVGMLMEGSGSRILLIWGIGAAGETGAARWWWERGEGISTFSPLTAQTGVLKTVPQP